MPHGHAQVWVPKAIGESDCRTHIPRARPRVFLEKCINVERDPRLRDMGIPLFEKVGRRAESSTLARLLLVQPLCKHSAGKCTAQRSTRELHSHYPSRPLLIAPCGLCTG